MNKFFSVLLLILGSVSSNAWAVSFDCTKARSFAEKEICTKPVLSQADDDLYKLYLKARDSSHKSPEFKKFSQSLWLIREKCRTDECIVSWYSKANDLYASLANKTNNAQIVKAVPVTEFEPVSISDLKEHLDKYYGKKIAVTAFLQMYNNTALLKNGGLDSTPLLANIDSLSAADKKILISVGEDSTEGIFYGAIGDTPQGTRFVIKKVEWHLAQ
jgi:uncharacterized protein